MLKKSKYWTAFTATTRAKAEEAQRPGGPNRTGSTNHRLDAAGQSAGAGTGPHWTVTIIYQTADPPPETTTMQ